MGNDPEFTVQNTTDPGVSSKAQDVSMNGSQVTSNKENAGVLRSIENVLGDNLLGMSACGSCTSFTLIGCMLSPSVANCIHGCTTAKKLREQHGLEASGYKLAMAHWCCGTCAKTQELRLVKMVREAKEAALTQQAPVRQTMAGSPAM